jgi:hypothetical protein
MKQSLPVRDSGGSEISREALPQELSPRQQPEVDVAGDRWWSSRLCLICRTPLEACNSKTCPGECSRKRKVQLQRLRRQLARR